MHNVFIALGSNIGNREEHLFRAITAISQKMEGILPSSIYETEPWGYLDQGKFYNMVLTGKTALSPRDLLLFLKDIEKEVGRTPNFTNGPRVIDLDILFYDNERVNEEMLKIPHPRLHERSFVLVPLCEIAPDFIHPNFGEPLKTILSKIDQSGVTLVKRLEFI